MKKDPTKLVIDVYDIIAQQYASQYDGEPSDLLFLTKFLEQLSSGATILDAGCGDGRDMKYMIKNGYTVTGIDLSDRMLAIARKRCPDGTFRRMDIRSLDFSDGIFDGILSSYSLIHVQKSEINTVLCGFYRVLKPEGRLAIFAQQGESDHYVVEPFAPEKKTFFNFFTSEYLTKELSDVGFVDISIQAEHCSDPYNMSDTNLYVYAQKPVKGVGEQV